MKATIKIFAFESGTTFTVGHMDKYEFQHAAVTQGFEVGEVDDLMYGWAKFVDPLQNEDCRVKYLDSDDGASAIPITGCFESPHPSWTIEALGGVVMAVCERRDENVQLVLEWLTEDCYDVEWSFDYDMDEHGHPTIESFAIDCKIKTPCESAISLWIANRHDDVQVKILDDSSFAFIPDEVFYYVHLLTSFRYDGWDELTAKLEESGIKCTSQET